MPTLCCWAQEARPTRRNPSCRFPAQIPLLGALGVPVGFREAQKQPTLGGCPLKMSRAEPGLEGQVQRLTKQWRVRLGAETVKMSMGQPGPQGAHGLTDTNGTLPGTDAGRMHQAEADLEEAGRGSSRWEGRAELSTGKRGARGPWPCAECEEVGHGPTLGGGQTPGEASRVLMLPTHAPDSPTTLGG